MAQVRARFRFIVFVGTLVALFTVLTSTTVGAADPQIAGRISQTSNVTVATVANGNRGVATNFSIAGINNAGFPTRLGGGVERGIFVPNSSGGGMIVSVGTRLGSNSNGRGILVSNNSGTIASTGSSSFANAGRTRVSGTSGSGGAGTIATFRNGR